MRRDIAIATAALLAFSVVAPAASAQQTPRLGPDDVNDEPNAPETGERGVPGNGFTQQGPGGVTDVDCLDASTCEPPLILESYYVYDVQGTTVDINQLVNRAQHGDDYGSYDQVIYPGLGYFGVYWGWFADKGDQPNDVPAETTQENVADTAGGDEDDYVVASYDASEEADGEIFDDWDNETDPKDEFVWHGLNRWADKTGHESTDSDEMYGFIQPGSHEGIIYDPLDGVLEDEANEDGQPDILFGDRTDQSNQGWASENGFFTPMGENSLLMATNVTTTTNPPGDLRSGLNPTPKDSTSDQDRRYDIDIYQAASPQVETLYRTAIWDPGDEVDSPADAVAPEGAKVYTRETLLPTAFNTTDAALENATSEVPDPSSQAGYADDRAGVHPYAHEPNEDGDEYPHAPDNSNATYGGLDEYYEPQLGAESYTTYENEEHLWADSKIMTSYNLYMGVFAATFDEDVLFFFSNGGCCAPGTDGTSPGIEEDDGRHSQLPGAYDVDVSVGTWFDVNKDAFVGGPEDDPREFPYLNGTEEDPNDYFDNKQDASDEPDYEFRGTCGASVTTVVEPHDNDIDDDPEDDWGQPVYRMHNEPGREDPATGGFVGNPYPEMIGDATGGVGPVEDSDDEQFTYFRETGSSEPIPLRVTCNVNSYGNWPSDDQIVAPTGTIDHPVKVTTEVELTQDRMARDDAENAGDNLKGETITDVDIAKAWELG